MMMANETAAALVDATNATNATGAAADATAAAAATAAPAAATFLQLLGAFGFGALLGWYLYYINRHRTEEVKLADLATVIGAIAGTIVLSLFDAKTDLFGAYGTGLAAGFFGYYLLLVFYVWRSEYFDVAWFLDGRKLDDKKNLIIPGWTPAPKDTVPGGGQMMIQPEDCGTTSNPMDLGLDGGKGKPGTK
jgi:hypothetical protein